MEVKSGYSRLAEMQAVFQQRQSAAREQRLLQEAQDGVIGRSVITERRSAGSLTNVSTGAPITGTISTGKVRQMFDERRNRATGIDKSFPLQPLKTRPAPPVKTEYSYKPVQKSTTSTARRIQTNLSNGKTSTKVLRQPVGNSYGYVDRNNGYNTKNGYDEIESNETERIRSPQFRAEFQLSSLLNDTHISTLDEIDFPETSLDFEDNMEQATNRGSRRGSVGAAKPAAMHARTVLSPGSTAPTKMQQNSVAGSDVKKSAVGKNGLKSPVQSMVKSKPVKSMIGAKSQPSSPSKSVKAASTKIPPLPRQAATKSSGTMRGTQSSAGDLVACPICSRNFASDRIDKHREICQKTSQKKRKVYDTLKHRVQGTDAEQFVRVRTRKNASGTMQIPKRAPLQTNWRKKHEEFIAAIRAAKQVQEHIKKGGKLSDLPPPPPSENPDYIQCPHCGRRFNQAAAERHIPKCATMEHNKPKPGAKPGAKPGLTASRSTQRRK